MTTAMTEPAQPPADEQLRQATCAVLIGGQVRGTAWLLNTEGLLLTAGHILGETKPVTEVQVRFPEDVPRDAFRIFWSYQREAGLDFAVLKMSQPPADRLPLPISFDRDLTGPFRLRGYGRSLLDQSCGTGEIIGSFDPQDQPALRLLRLRSPELAEPGYSGGAVYLDAAQAVVGLQVEAALATTGAGRDTVLAMPLYRIAQMWEPLTIVRKGSSVVSVQAAAALTPLLTSGGAPTAAKRFVIRRESFGSMVYDTRQPDYIPFDADATEIFYRGGEPLDAVRTRMADRLSAESFDTFMDLCRSIDMVDDQGRFTGRFIHNRPSIAHLSAPLRVYLSCTKACNFSCGHCFSASGNPYPDELTTAEIKELIDEMARIGSSQLFLGGGEPLVRADLADIIGHANSREVTTALSTNAVAATPAVVKSLRGLRIASVKVSMEGASPASYDAIRGEPGAFQAALRGLANLRELAVPIYLHRVFMQPNLAEARALIRLAEQVDVGLLVLDTVMPVGRAANRPDLLLSPEETARLWDEVDALRANTKITVQIRRRVPFERSKYLGVGFGCTCGQTTCHIDARGNVAPSAFLQGIKPAGSLRQQSLQRIWDHGASFIEFRTVTSNPKCDSCSYLAECRGGCRARTILAGQEINLPDPTCLIEPSADPALAAAPGGSGTAD
jgi:radical SAM protein with 4Fe4S-binding SPASM domain